MSPSPEKAFFIYPGGISADHRYALFFAPLRLKGLTENGTLTQQGDGDYLRRHLSKQRSCSPKRHRRAR